MNLADAMQEYFRGERQLGVGLATLGVVLAVAAVWVWRTQKSTFGQWLWVAGGLLALVFVLGGIALVVKTDRQVVDLQQQLDADQTTMIASESARMVAVNAAWPRLKLAWGGLTLVALVLLLLVRKEWATALGLTLMFVSTTLFFVDVFAERRAVPYTEALEHAGGS
jgi:hypothetical protein